MPRDHLILLFCLRRHFLICLRLVLLVRSFLAVCVTRPTAYPYRFRRPCPTPNTTLSLYPLQSIPNVSHPFLLHWIDSSNRQTIDSPIALPRLRYCRHSSSLSIRISDRGV
uniref:Uncharacterized protein n=1 Tax=Cacopsylla melanoneura TaxID=428564 RepID=A0A8D9AEH9_9HEMI